MGAATIAALAGDKDPEELMDAAILRFRCISWDVLKHRSDVICDGGSLDKGGSRAEQNLAGLAEKCDIAACDTFLSHAWPDAADLKWNALFDWCEDFREGHGRAPKIWLDKVCIDQTDVSADLACLPIFLAGCNHLLVLSGKIYVSRLWCIMELFVYVSMLHDGDEDYLEASVVPLIHNAKELAELRRSWEQFDAQNCKCFLESDKDKILQIIDGTTVASANSILK